MKRVHTIDSWATIAIAVLAFGLSYTKLVDLAERAGYGTYTAHTWPLIVDGLTIVATRGVLRLTHHRGYAWALLAASTIVSMVAAVANQLLPPGPLPPIASAAASVVPPLCLLVAPHLAVLLARDAKLQPDVVKVAPVADDAAALDPPAAEEPVDRRALALELLDTTDLSIRAVAKKVGVTDTTVRRWKAAVDEPREIESPPHAAELVGVGGT